MVSFSCESCGDVLTKKKLDSHRGQCRGASFTCLDCMTHFRGTDYKAHTSCISEAQKYQGALYKEKPAKARKSVTISESTSLVPRKAYVEDAPDAELTALTSTNAPPPAPSPPSALPSQPVNVFDFLVNDETPNASRVSLGGSHSQMQMVEHAPSVFDPDRRRSSHSLERSQSPLDYDQDHEYDSAAANFPITGYSYGADPVPTTTFETPAPKPRPSHSAQNSLDLKSTSQKRKRQVEDLDLTQARRSSQELDEEMLDAPPILHSGLTGGLNRLLSKSNFPPSPDYSGGDGNELSALSPVKRPKQIVGVERDKNGARGRQGSSALIKVRKVRRPSDESRPRKHHRAHRHHSDEHVRTHSEKPKRALKQIEYPSQNGVNEEDRRGQLVLYRSRAELFLSFVTKGPESDRGCSVNKALKRYHRERGESGLGLGKAEEEKELWREVRLRRNERGEVVVVF